MISLIHTRGSVTVQYPSLEEYEQPPSKYAIGWTKPNYPMPAIPLIVSLDETEVTLWSDPVDVGPDLVEWRKALVTWSIFGPPTYI